MPSEPSEEPAEQSGRRASGAAQVGGAGPELVTLDLIEDAATLFDPNGVKVELNFEVAEVKGRKAQVMASEMAAPN